MIDFNPYTYVKDDNFVVEPVAGSSKCHHLKLIFQSACPTDYPEMDTVTGDYYLPENAAKPPLVVLAHGVDDTSTMTCRLLARALTKAGIASLTLHMPIHYNGCRKT